MFPVKLHHSRLTNKYSYVPLRFSIWHTCTLRGITPSLSTKKTQAHMSTNTCTATPANASRCVHTQMHTLLHDTQSPWNPWQISCCSYVKWIKPPGSSKSSQLTHRDNSQTATCLKPPISNCDDKSRWWAYWGLTWRMSAFGYLTPVPFKWI